MISSATLHHFDDPPTGSKSGKILARRSEVAKLYRDGEGQIEIARLLGVARKVVTFDLAALRIEWRASSIRDFDALREKELERIDRLELEAWNSWELSHRDDQPDGNPKFLDLVRDCIQERCRLLGLYAPTKSDSTVTGSVVVASTFLGRDEMRQTVLDSLAKRHGIASGGNIGGGKPAIEGTVASGNGHHPGRSNGNGTANGNGKPPPLQSP